MTNIYGIYNNKNNALIYVGSTSRECKERWAEHRRELKKGTHSNKTLQKYFIKNELTLDDLGFELLHHLEIENSLIKMTLEMMTISLLRPIANKCCYQSGRAMMTFKRCDDPIICQNVINAIMNQN